jgi:molecular chaperone HscA
LVGNKGDSEVLLLDVLPLSLGLEMMGGLAEKIIPRNTAIPANQTKEFTTQKDGQTSMKIHVVQGERDMVSDCRSLAEFELKGIPSMVAGAARVRVSFQVDADGLLSVSASELTAGIEAGVEVKPSYGLTDSEITEMLTSSFEMAEEDAILRMISEARVEAARVTEALAVALKEDAEMLDVDEVVLLEEGMRKLGELVKKDDHKAINEGIDLLSKASEEFAALRMDKAINKALAGQKINDIDQEI